MHDFSLFGFIYFFVLFQMFTSLTLIELIAKTSSVVAEEAEVVTKCRQHTEVL
jgi:hypothetical protein